jgi:hypothetical protein
MADVLYYWVGLGTLLVFVIVVLPIYGFLSLRRWIWRNHVWVEIRTLRGPKQMFLHKPEEDGTIVLKNGHYFPPEHFELYSGGWRLGGLKPLYSYMEGDLRPLAYTQKFVMSANPGKLVKVSVAAHQAIPAPTLAVYMKQKMFADAYSGRGALILIILIGLVVLFLMVAGLYVRR